MSIELLYGDDWLRLLLTAVLNGIVSELHYVETSSKLIEVNSAGRSIKEFCSVGRVDSHVMFAIHDKHAVLYVVCGSGIFCVVYASLGNDEFKSGKCVNLTISEYINLFKDRQAFYDKVRLEMILAKDSGNI